MFQPAPKPVNRISNIGLTIVRFAADAVLPPVCSLCLAAGQRRRGLQRLDLCVHCEQACPPVPMPCPCCGEPNTMRGKRCSSCTLQPRQFDRAHCAFLYADPVDQMITGLKFGHDLVFARVLGTLLANHITTQRGNAPSPDCIIPMPLHTGRLRERGFNQALEIARVLGHQLSLRVDQRLLLRSRATFAQSKLSAQEREQNLQQAFVVRQGAQAPRHVAIIDDVLTTGSTANAAAASLRRAGAQQIEIWVCARAARRY
jgi:ComF family protein